jgi:signal transduction histidine kinase
MLCLALGIILFVALYQRRALRYQSQMREFNRQKQMELMQASIRSEEDERMRIASELHDDVGATLSSIRLFLTQAARNPGDVSLILQSKDLLDDSIQKIRDLSHQLQPGTLQYLGLARALQSLAETITRSGTIQIEFIQEAMDWPEPDSQVALSLYRIIQELINNIIKHAGASWIRIVIFLQNGRNCIRVTHNGKGLTEEDYQKHLFKKGAIGLKNIENRLKSSNLSIYFPVEESSTYSVTICTPQLIP